MGERRGTLCPYGDHLCSQCIPPTPTRAMQACTICHTCYMCIAPTRPHCHAVCPEVYNFAARGRQPTGTPEQQTARAARMDENQRSYERACTQHTQEHEVAQAELISQMRCMEQDEQSHAHTISRTDSHTHNTNNSDHIDHSNNTTIGAVIGCITPQAHRNAVNAALLAQGTVYSVWGPDSVEAQTCSVGECENDVDPERFCKRCHGVWYCSLTCQRQDWKEHRSEDCDPEPWKLETEMKERRSQETEAPP